MSTEENKAIVRRLIEEGWVNHDILKELFAEDVVWLGLGSNDIHDFESLKRAAATEKSGFPDWHFTVDDLVAESDKVFVRWTGTGTHTGEWSGFSPTGRQVKWQGANCIRIVDGKIVEIWHLANILHMLGQLNVLPPWEELVEQANSKQR
jgi:predicted ester cyclase